MISRIPLILAVNTMIVLLGCFLIFHLLVLLQVTPYEMVWGGQLKTVNEMIVFELVSLIITSVLLITIHIRGNYLNIRHSPKTSNIILYSYILLFVVNTIGNLFSETSLETVIFTPFAILAIILCYRIGKHKVYGETKKEG